MQKTPCVWVTALAVALGAGFLLSSARADGNPGPGTPPGVVLNVTWPGGSWSIDPTNPASPGFGGATYDGGADTWRLWGDWSGGAGAWRCIWDLEVNPDPFINAGFEFVNNLAGPQDFSVSASLLTSVSGAFPQMRGGISGTLVDATGGATLRTNTANNPVYNAKIDGNVVRTLLNPLYTTSVPDGFTDNWGPPAPANFAFEPSPPVANQIGMDFFFNLTGGGDRATLTARFEVIPEPATLALFALGAIATLRRKR